MQYHNNQSSLVGVVPRHRAQTLDALMSDAPESWSVADEVEIPDNGRPAVLAQWLSGAAAFGIVAAALEWLKLTR